MKSKLNLIVLFLIGAFSLNAQRTLEQEILQQDSLLFDVGFNNCLIEQFEELLAADFEFYHGKAGFSNREKFLNDLSNGLCFNRENFRSRRMLHTRKTEVFPLYHADTIYGVLQIGEHSFFEQMGLVKEKYVSTAKFQHLWILEAGKWKLKRVVSYEHKKRRIRKRGH